MTSKEFFFDAAIAQAQRNNPTKLIRVLELGCGTAKYVPAMLTRYPSITYVGVEPIAQSFERARETIKGIDRARVVHQLGYDSISGEEVASFDLVISFSVLEHVKQLDRFLALGATYLSHGGLFVHRYDLGHALYPGSLKERIHVWLGNTLPFLLPERTFVRYVPLQDVERLYMKYLGNLPYQYTHHQMPSQKLLYAALLFSGKDVSVLTDIYQWEMDHSELFSNINEKVREKIFPTVALWGRKD